MPTALPSAQPSATCSSAYPPSGISGNLPGNGAAPPKPGSAPPSVRHHACSPFHSAGASRATAPATPRLRLSPSAGSHPAVLGPDNSEADSRERLQSGSDRLFLQEHIVLRVSRYHYRRSRNEVTLRERLSSGIPWVSDECRPLLLWATFIGMLSPASARARVTVARSPTLSNPVATRISTSP